MDTANCPHCHHPLDLGGSPQISQYLLCPVCSAWLEVISVNPPEVDWQFLEPGLIVREILDFVSPQQRGYNKMVGLR